jgi:hypothetical protein
MLIASIILLLVLETILLAQAIREVVKKRRSAYLIAAINFLPTGRTNALFSDEQTFFFLKINHAKRSYNQMIYIFNC